MCEFCGGLQTAAGDVKLRSGVNGQFTPGRKVPLFHRITGGVGPGEGINVEERRTHVSCTRESNPTPVHSVPTLANRWPKLQRLSFLHYSKQCQ
jgi:hypothetical protein